ncbi:MAG: hypothetical protein JW959_12450 [Pirellulales bacterium]|nr:hypothetical protein [Pirellulales bacterium]
MTIRDDQLLDLFGALCNGRITAEEQRRLSGRLLADPEARSCYVKYMDLHLALMDLEVVGDGSDLLCIEDQQTSKLAISEPPLAVFPLSLLASPLSPSFVGGPVFSYMVASVILCVMLLGAWVYKINHVHNISTADSRNSSTSGSLEQRQLVFVGRVTGMKDCRWAEPDAGTYLGASAPLGREYALASGLMEITYQSGAKVILEGPCSYTVESPAAGFLARGKLTARIVQQRPAASAADAKPQAVFSICTPTALVIDLGTEFGVEVAENGDATSHVFQGSVQVKILSSPANGKGARDEGSIVQLAAGESVLVIKDEAESVRFTRPATPLKFVRRIYEPPKQLDLLDVVAGGDGTGNRRERGIDQASGMQDTWYADNVRFDDHEYHPVIWNKFVDGVFVPYVPSYRSRTVQLDSAGNAFNGFTDRRIIDGALIHEVVNGKTTGSIWARAADAYSSAEGWKREGLVYALNNDEALMPAGRGLMLLHSNAGITFDLAAVRETFRDVYPARFRATAGMGDGPRAHPHAFGMADVWLFVDGRLEWKRFDLCAKDGAVQIDVPLGQDVRFLTIVSTNGRYGQGYDWVVLGDPTLEIEPVGEN